MVQEARKAPDVVGGKKAHLDSRSRDEADRSEGRPVHAASAAGLFHHSLSCDLFAAAQREDCRRAVQAISEAVSRSTADTEGGDQTTRARHRSIEAEGRRTFQTEARVSDRSCESLRAWRNSDT